MPEKPGLGLTLDRDELERLASRELPPIKPWIVKSQFANGTRMYNRYDPLTTRHFLIRPDWTRGGMPHSYAAPIETEYWDDDGTPEFAQMMARLMEERTVLER